MLRPRGRSNGKVRLIIGLVIAAFSLFSYFTSTEYNEETGEEQRVTLSPDEEVALGLQAKPEMMQQHGGLNPDPQKQAFVDEIGWKLVRAAGLEDTPWQWEFHLLDDDQLVNAFALPGGQVFITDALANRLDTEGQFAGVIGHEIAHVVARHGAQRLAKSQLTSGLIGAVAVASESQQTAAMAALVANVVNMKYGREDELQSDRLGVAYMSDAGYDPRSMVRVMEILAEAGGSGGRPPEFFSTHPNPDNRIERIREAVAQEFPDGVPEGLIP